MDEIRARVIANPSYIQEMIASLRTTQPGVASLIEANQQGFVEMIFQGVSSAPVASQVPASSISAEDSAAIERVNLPRKYKNS